MRRLTPVELREATLIPTGQPIAANKTACTLNLGHKLVSCPTSATHLRRYSPTPFGGDARTSARPGRERAIVVAAPRVLAGKSVFFYF